MKQLLISIDSTIRQELENEINYYLKLNGELSEIDQKINLLAFVIKKYAKCIADTLMLH